MRISAGEAKGRRLRVPRGGAVRPTQDRVREAIFNALGDRVVGARVLDLFAGAGTLGIEALSRGADCVVFVERDPRAVGVLRDNLAASGFADRGEVWRSDALRAIRTLAERREAFDVVLCDPPYGAGWAERALDVLSHSGIVGSGGLVVVEAGRGESIRTPRGFRRVRERAYGETLVLFFVREDNGRG
ncbi:MAG: 16S rRNA (guanine(966)-N(2))-methyltransferase RsmD [Armatimonadota bacterium]|nr:16S rRNA (guanine(966)-N(2))-methyltransferase RsmD [Armatimonadota bacterium]MDR5697459.1 16S rRNA (guanine(966)-N(2))-methyltransferase RsmD [Armatimonadota bacterium]